MARTVRARAPAAAGSTAVTTPPCLTIALAARRALRLVRLRTANGVPTAQLLPPSLAPLLPDSLTPGATLAGRVPRLATLTQLLHLLACFHSLEDADDHVGEERHEEEHEEQHCNALERGDDRGVYLQRPPLRVQREGSERLVRAAWPRELPQLVQPHSARHAHH